MAKFSFFNYEKPGKGVDKDAPQKKRFFLFFELLFRKFWKLIQINVLFLLCCIPIVTIGPAVAGLTYVLRNFSWEKPVFVAGDFFDEFKKNFKQAFFLGLLDFAASFVIFFATYFYYERLEQDVLFFILFIIAMSAALLFVFMHFYAYLMVVTNTLTIPQIIKNSFFLAVIGLRTNFITGFFLLLISLATYLFSPSSLLLILLITPALMGFIICFNSFPYILKYVVKEDDEDEEDEDEKPEPIFKDIGSKEIPVEVEKPKTKKKIRRIK